MNEDGAEISFVSGHQEIKSACKKLVKFGDFAQEFSFKCLSLCCFQAQ